MLKNTLVLIIFFMEGAVEKTYKIIMLHAKDGCCRTQGVNLVAKRLPKAAALREDVNIV